MVPASLSYVPLILLLLSGCAAGPPVTEKSTAPNIIFLFSDDQTFGTVRALGDSTIHTPNLDRLVAGGTTFTHAFNMGGWNGAICLASRAMLNSGRSLWRAQTQTAQWAARDSAAMAQTWSQLLRSAGYRTYLTGKWHVDAPAEEVFDSVAHLRPGMPRDAWIKRRETLANAGTAYDDPDLPPAFGYNRPLHRADTAWSPSDLSNGGFYEGGTHWSEVVRADAIDFLAHASTSPGPFFLYLAFNAPHDPRQAPQQYQDLYPTDSMPLPPAYRAEHPDREGMGTGPQLRDEALAPFPRTPLAIRTHRSEYYALITHLDEQIGQILDAVKASGQAGNTYLIFTSDHGLSVGHHGLVGKQNLYDHSIRVPFVLVGPEVPAGRSIAADIYLQDAMATVLDLAGVPPPPNVEFHSVLPLLRGAASPYPAIYGAYIDRQRMIRQDGYKLLVYPTIGKLELYDLRADPHELNDLAGTPVQRERVGRPFQALVDLQSDLEDSLDLGTVADYLPQPMPASGS